MFKRSNKVLKSEQFQIKIAYESKAETSMRYKSKAKTSGRKWIWNRNSHWNQRWGLIWWISEPIKLMSLIAHVPMLEYTFWQSSMRPENKKLVPIWFPSGSIVKMPSKFGTRANLSTRYLKTGPWTVERVSQKFLKVCKTSRWFGQKLKSKSWIFVFS